MIYWLSLILLLVFIVDIIFYIPFCFHIYQDNKRIYLFFYSIPVIMINEKKNINRLKNKISIEKLKETKKEDLKIIDSVKIKKVYIRINANTAYLYSYIFYPLIYINDFNENIDYKIDKYSKFYFIVNVTISNIIFKIIKIRRIKNERTSN